MSARGKRILDIAAAAIGLVVLAPLIAAVAAAIRLQSPGPALFRQTRVGRHGVPFTCYKLRSMHAGTTERPTHETPAIAVTPFGHWLRRSKFDELPQLFNVLRGELSLVGPRPCLPSQKELIDLRHTLGVLDVRPGITGLAQIMGIDMSRPRRLAKVDAIYVDRQSLALDLRIIGATLTRRGGSLGRRR